MSEEEAVIHERVSAMMREIHERLCAIVPEYWPGATRPRETGDAELLLHQVMESDLGFEDPPGHGRVVIRVDRKLYEQLKPYRGAGPGTPANVDSLDEPLTVEELDALLWAVGAIHPGFLRQAQDEGRFLGRGKTLYAELSTANSKVEHLLAKKLEETE